MKKFKEIAIGMGIAVAVASLALGVWGTMAYATEAQAQPNQCFSPSELTLAHPEVSITGSFEFACANGWGGDAGWYTVSEDRTWVDDTGNRWYGSEPSSTIPVVHDHSPGDPPPPPPDPTPHPITAEHPVWVAFETHWSSNEYSDHPFKIQNGHITYNGDPVVGNPPSADWSSDVWAFGVKAEILYQKWLALPRLG